jgi:hypothetical protein
MALAELLGVYADRHARCAHFVAVRLASGGTFDLVVLATEPDRS